LHINARLTHKHGPTD